MSVGNCTIAIVGIGCVLPDAPTPAAFWSNALAGRSALRPLDGWRWDGRHHDPDPSAPDRTYCRVGAFVSGHALDWRKYRISPASARAMNPMQLYLLDAGTQALEGLHELPRERTGIFLGATGLGWKPDAGLSIRLSDLLEAVRQGDAFAALPPAERERILEDARASLAARLEPVSEDHGVNAATSIAAGRIAMHFDLRGLHYAVDAGGASSLAALEMGVRSLRDGTVDLALVGGASELLTPLGLVTHAKLGVLAREELRPFDPGSEGTLLGEGAACFALKRLEDALAAGERIYAVVRGVAGATAPGARPSDPPAAGAQRLAMARAFEDAGVSADGVGYVECHAGGVPLADAAELEALAGFFRGRPRESVAVCATKPLVGDLGGGAGAVALLRATLALHHGRLPPQLPVPRPHPLLSGEANPLFVPGPERPAGPPPAADRPRAAVNALGLGGAAFHAVLEAHRSAPVARARPRPPRREPVAVIGLGAVLPGSRGAGGFWRSLLDRRDSTREVPRSRWDVDRYFDPDPRRGEKTYARLGCFLDELPSPEDRWSIPLAALPSLDPGQLLVLRAAEEALSDAGLDRDPRHRDRTAVVLGFLPVQGRRYLADARLGFRELELELGRALAAHGVDAERAAAVLAEAERRYKADLPPIDEHTLPGFLGSVSASRIARRFGLGGPHFVVDSACSSTLAALHAAVQGLRERAYDAVICGGVWTDLQPEFLVAMSRFYGPSASGITPFDARANGFLMGEGTGILVLQRLADAESEGRRIHALVRAVAGTSDGKGRSIFAPSPAGEADAMRRAVADAGIEAADLDYIECHGTGTQVGDVAEIDACTRAYGKGRARPLLVGSVKSNMGHLMAAAAAPALLKAVLAVRDGVIPPSLKFERPNPKIDFASGPVRVVTEATPWQAPAGRPRLAGVNAFGLGGTNFHAIVEEYRPTAAARASPPRPERLEGTRRVLPIAAAAGSDLASCAGALRDLAVRLRGLPAEDRRAALARSQREASEGGPWRAAVVAAEPGALERRVALLQRELDRGGDLAVLRPQGVFAARLDPALRAAALFPGQGPQYAHMLRDALAAFPELGETLDAVDRAYEELCGRALRPSFLCDEPEHHARSDEDAHCAVFAVNLALFRLFRSFGLRVDAVAGQSAGEISALVAAGALTLEQGLAVVRERTLAVLALDVPDPGRMVGLACGSEQAAPLLGDLPGYAALAADNGPTACIVSAVTPAAEALAHRAAERGIRAEILPVSHAYHSALIAGARTRYRGALEAIAFRAPDLEVFSTITGASLRGMAPDRFADHLSSQFVEPVRLRQAIDALHASGARLFLECGPKWPLTTFVGGILSARPHVAQASLHPKVGEVEQLQRALACLFVHGIGELHPMNDRDPVSREAERPQARSDAAAQGEARATQPVPSAPDRDLVALLAGVRDLIDAFLRRAGVAEAGAADASAAAVAVPSTSVRAEASVARPGQAKDGAAPGGPAPSTRSEGVLRDGLHRMIVEELARRTGYPNDMLDPELDLEADLGIDTVKQVAVLAAVRERLHLAPDPAFRLRDASTIRTVVDYLARRLGPAVAAPAGGRSAPANGHAASPANGHATSPANGHATSPGNGHAAGANGHAARPNGHAPPRPNGHAAHGAAPGRDGQLVQAEVAAAPAAAPRPPAPVARDAPPAGPDRARVHRLLLDELVKRTGYPEDMLELDLDLEGELGIDTVKQVAALAAVRDALGLPADPAFRLRDASTLRRVLDHFACRLEQRDARAPHANPAAHLAQAAPPPPVQERAVPPPPAAEGELLGAMLAGAWEHAGRPPGEIAELAVSSWASAVTPVGIEVAPWGPGKFRVTARQATARAEAVFGSAGAPAAERAPPEILAAATPGPGAENGDRLREILGEQHGGAIRWARARGASVVVAGARLDPAAPLPEAVATILRCAADVAAYGWYGLTGSCHRVARMERVRLAAPSALRGDVLLHARIAAPRGGSWRADVTVIDRDGRLVAEISSVAGAPATAAPRPASADLASDAAAAWQAFSRELEPAPRERATSWPAIPREAALVPGASDGRDP